MSKAIFYFFIIFYLLGISNTCAQSTVFTDLKKDRSRAIDYFEKGNYIRALSILEEIEKKGNLDPELLLIMGKANQKLNRPLKAAFYFSEYEEKNPDLDDNMLLELAEIYAQSGNYQKAINKYTQYAEYYPSNVKVKSKIWRLNNIKYLYEDSAYYQIIPVPVNTIANESGVTYYKNGIVFLSDRPEFGGVKKLDRSTHLPFTRWLYCTVDYDTSNQISHVGEPVQFGHALDIRYNKGNLYFYDNFHRFVFSANAEHPAVNDILTLNLYFASLRKNKWQVENQFSFNSPNYSISQPFISDNEDTLYFSSDMPDGYGGMDLYFTKKDQNGWTKPVNLGPDINTPGNEGHPFINNGVLYFSSDGHEGLGGLDIYKIYLNFEYFKEPENLGFPLNSNFDDFGLVLNTNGDQGYFTSNRNEDQKDDIFHVRILLQTFPLNIRGSIKLKDPSSNIDSLYSLKNADLFLIDKRRNLEVYHTVTSTDGTFSVIIPYHSQYQLKISKPELGSVLVSFDISREDNLDTGYEIVVVKELFQFDKK